MATLTVEDVVDISKTTLENLDKGAWTDLTSDTQEFIALPKLLKKDPKIQTGRDIQVNIMKDVNNTFRWVGLGELDQYNDKDVMDAGNAPWRHANWNYSLDNRLAEINQGSAEQIVDIVQTKRAAAFSAAANEIEEAFWSKPTDSTDEKTMWGVGNYIVKNASTGFNGGNPTGFTSGCIFNTSTYARWANYTAQYVSVTITDLVRKIRSAMDYTFFKSPVSMKEIRGDSLRRTMYSNFSVCLTLEELAAAQNDNLGSDLAAKDGDVFIRKVPIQRVPYLNNDTQNPVYAIDWATFVPVFLKGEYMAERKPRIHPLQHQVVVHDIDMTGNIVCFDRRRQFVIATA